MPLPTIPKDRFAHIVTNELDNGLHGVHKHALRHEPLGLPALEGEDDDEQQSESHTHPEDIVGQAQSTRANKRLGHKAVEQLVHLVRQPIEWVCDHSKQYSIHHPSFPSARLA